MAESLMSINLLVEQCAPVVHILARELQGGGLSRDPKYGIVVAAGLEYVRTRQLHVQDAVAPPPTRPACYRSIPRAVPAKRQRCRRKTGGGGSDGWGDDIDADDIGNGGDDVKGPGDWDGGRGDGGRWNRDWDEEWQRWRKPGDPFTLLYQAACWLTLSRCLYHTLALSLGKIRRLQSDGGGASAFARCTSALSSLPGFRVVSQPAVEAEAN